MELSFTRGLLPLKHRLVRFCIPEHSGSHLDHCDQKLHEFSVKVIVGVSIFLEMYVLLHHHIH